MMTALHSSRARSCMVSGCEEDPALLSYWPTHSFFRRIYQSSISRFIATMLVALVIAAWSSLAFCDEIHDAVRTGNLAKAKALLIANSDLTASTDSGGQTPLHLAAFRGDRNMVALLLAYKADVNATDEYALTPLHLAAASGRYKDRDTLLEACMVAGRNLLGKNNLGKPLLPSATVLRGYRDVLALLLAHGADVHATGFEGLTPLYLAANKDVAALMLAHKADARAKNGMDLTTLHLAVNKEVAALLVAHKADINARDRNGWTPLVMAVFGNHKDVVALLLAHNADVNARTISGGTALHDAAYAGETDIMALLLANDSEVNAKDVDGSTPLHVATERGFKDVVGLLLAHNADINARDYRGNTALHLAENKDVAELLRQHGGHE